MKEIILAFLNTLLDHRCRAGERTVFGGHMKRISLLGIGMSILGSIDASGCRICSFLHNPPYSAICVTRTAGADYCQFDTGDPDFCLEVGDCGPLARTTVTAQYVVASVERLDDR